MKLDQIWFETMYDMRVYYSNWEIKYSYFRHVDRIVIDSLNAA